MHKSSFFVFFVFSIFFYISNRKSAVKKTKRPFLKSSHAKKYKITNVLKYTGNAGSLVSDKWNPESDTFMQLLSEFKADYIVDKNYVKENQRIFKTIQSAINTACLDAVKKLKKKRIYIEIKPGVYNEILMIPGLRSAITLYSADPDASSTKIKANIDQGLNAADYAKQFNPDCKIFTDDPDITHPDIWSMYNNIASISATIGTCYSSVVWIKNNNFQAKNLTFENSYDQSRTGNLHQAVAVKVDAADRVHFENCRFIGNQDTLFINSGYPGSIKRSYFNNCHIQGDVDFIFGNGCAYFNKCEIKWQGVRKNGSNALSGFIAAPSTNYNVPFGFVFNDCNFTSDGIGLAALSQVYLCRQWFEEIKNSPYSNSKVAVDLTNGSDNENSVKLNTLETAGKMIILNSRIGSHINKLNPWHDWNNKPGHKAYRLVQYNSDDYWENLKKININPSVIYKSRKKPQEPFLAEYNNTDTV